jgi:uncharacterized membrane protein
VFEPIESATQTAIVWYLWDMRTEPPAAPKLNDYARLDTRQWIPRHIYEEVNDNPGDDPPQSARAYFDRYVRIHYLQRSRVIPVFLAAFVLGLYLVGKFFAAGLGHWLWSRTEAVIQRVPLVRNVYSAVKQVTDFVFKEPTVEFNRVVAVEYPRKGMWSIGFVTGEGMLSVRSAAGAPVLSVLIPTSPIPGTGFTVTVRKSETIDLDMTVDQAIQFIVSCGVVIPPQQLYRDNERGGVSPVLPAASPGDGLPQAELCQEATP